MISLRYIVRRKEPTSLSHTTTVKVKIPCHLCIVGVNYNNPSAFNGAATISKTGVTEKPKE